MYALPYSRNRSNELTSILAAAPLAVFHCFCCWRQRTFHHWLEPLSVLLHLCVQQCCSTIPLVQNADTLPRPMWAPSRGMREQRDSCDAWESSWVVTSLVARRSQLGQIFRKVFLILHTLFCLEEIAGVTSFSSLSKGQQWRISCSSSGGLVV